MRAALAVRLNGIARGGSGAGVAVAEVLMAMLNAGVHPVVPEIGSVGAADIGQMAGMAQVAIGMGRAEYRGEVVPGGGLHPDAGHGDPRAAEMVACGVAHCWAATLASTRSTA